MVQPNTPSHAVVGCAHRAPNGEEKALDRGSHRLVSPCPHITLTPGLEATHSLTSLEEKSR